MGRLDRVLGVSLRLLPPWVTAKMYFMTARSSKTVFAKGGSKSCLWGLVEVVGSFLLLPDVGLFYGCFVLRSGAPGSQENYFIYTNLGLLRDL
jgi:hypothetical protein